MNKETIKELINEMGDQLGHEICMGIRHGLYGCNAAQDESLWQQLPNLKTSLDNIAEALNNIANNMGGLEK